ncbi:MAG: ABC transporter permease [Oscillospiraceae bacterium]|nr:ABC transporter permease [Oscillospiraceae bacterium]
MPVFKAYLKVLRRKAPVAMIYLLVFLAISVAMTLSSDSTAEKFEDTKMNICIFDEDGTDASRALCDLIGNRHHLVTLENTRDTLLDALYYERVSFVLTVRKGYAEKLAAQQTDGLFESLHLHDSYSYVLMMQFLDEYAGVVSAYEAGGMSLPDAVAHAGSTLSEQTEVKTAVFEQNAGGILPKNAAFFFRYLPYILLCLLMNTLGPVLLTIMRKEIRYRTNCSGIRQSACTAQIFAGCAVCFLGIWLLFVAAGMFMNGGMYRGYAWIAVLNSLIFSLFSAALAVLVASFQPGVQLINIITQVVSLGMSFLCGVFVEQSMLGSGVLKAARFLPAYWYIRVNQMLEGTDPFRGSDVAAALCIEAGFAVVTALLAALIRQIRYSEAAHRLPLTSAGH